MDSLALSSNPFAAAPSASPAETLARTILGLLQAGAAAPGEAAAPKPGSILNLLLNPRNSAAPMNINLDQLVSGSALQALLKQLPAELMARPQVFQALVLQTTLLPNAPARESPQTLPQLVLPNNSPAATTAGAPTQYRITLEWQNRLLQIISPQAFSRGAQLQLQSTASGAVILLAQTAAPRVAQAAPQSSTPAAPLPAPAAALNPAMQALQQSARSLLPRQQPLHTLLPQLQKFLQPGLREQLPSAVVKAVAQLLQAMPRAEQMRNPQVVRHAVENSGSFLESRLSRTAAGTPPTPEAQARTLVTDIKAQINSLLTTIRSFAPDIVTQARAPLSATEELVYNKPMLGAQQNSRAGTDAVVDSGDALLGQLSKLLLAGLARVQLNQLDGASARLVGTEAQPPVPTWLIDIPLRTPHGADQLQLRIEQHRRQQQGRAQMQWNVDIALDLHAAGKLTAALTIVDKSVAAVLWAEQQNTHAAVRDEMDYLRAGLESVGVTVTEMQCRLGTAPARTSVLTQKLVDIHT